MDGVRSLPRKGEWVLGWVEPRKVWRVVQWSGERWWTDWHGSARDPATGEFTRLAGAVSEGYEPGEVTRWVGLPDA